MYLFKHRMISGSVLPLADAAGTVVAGGLRRRIRTTQMMCKARLALRLPPRLSRCRRPAFATPCYLTVKPASTGNVTPVTKRASSDTSHMIALLMSIAPTVGTGIRLDMPLATAGFSAM